MSQLDLTPGWHLAVAVLAVVVALLGVPLALAGSVSLIRAVIQGVALAVVAALNIRSAHRKRGQTTT
jgi:hypothetical protein